MHTYSRRIAGLLCVISGAVTLSAAPSTRPFGTPVVFEPNRGQAPQDVSWLARGPGYQFLLTQQGSTVVLQEGRPDQAGLNTFTGEPVFAALSRSRVSTVQMHFKGSHAPYTFQGMDATGGLSNYLRGGEATAWLTDIPQYGKVRVNNVYNGIDVVFYSHGGNIEYDFVVAPGADPQQIRVAFDGSSGVKVDAKTGDLVITTALGSELRHARPRIFQEKDGQRVEIAGNYTLINDAEARFTLAEYDRSKTLLIDPTIVFTKFLAGSNSDVGGGIAVDASGNSYLTGYTFSNNFPTLPSESAHGGADAFVTKLSSTGTILFSTYLGGVGTDLGTGIAVDSAGVYVTGYTDSKDFPSRDHRGPKGGDAFITKLSLANGSMVYTYFLGGTNIDSGYAIAVDANHAVYVAGITYSNDFPAFGSIQSNFGGYRDAFVAKLNPVGYYLDWATYIGGSGFDAANGIAVDASGYTYVTGVTASPDFPDVGPSQGYVAGASSMAFVTKLLPTGLGAVYSILWGGGADSGTAIKADGNGNAFVAGATSSPNLLTSSGAFQKSKPSPATNISAFATKITDPGIWVFSTYLSGANGDTYANAITLDRAGDVYIAGDTSSTTFPGGPALTPNPTAGYFVKLNPYLSTLNYTVFLGAKINGLAITQPVTRFPIFTYPTIYTSGYRYTGGTNAVNTDAFVVKLDERPVLTQLP